MWKGAAVRPRSRRRPHLPRWRGVPAKNPAKRPPAHPERESPSGSEKIAPEQFQEHLLRRRRDVAALVPERQHPVLDRGRSERPRQVRDRGERCVRHQVSTESSCWYPNGRTTEGSGARFAGSSPGHRFEVRQVGRFGNTVPSVVRGFADVDSRRPFRRFRAAIDASTHYGGSVLTRSSGR